MAEQHDISPSMSFLSKLFDMGWGVFVPVQARAIGRQAYWRYGGYGHALNRVSVDGCQNFHYVRGRMCD